MLLICVVRFISLGIKYVMCNGGVLVWIHVSLRFCLVDTFCTGFFVVFFFGGVGGFTTIEIRRLTIKSR